MLNAHLKHGFFRNGFGGLTVVLSCFIRAGRVASPLWSELKGLDQ